MPSFTRNRSSSPSEVQVYTTTPTKTVGFPIGASPVTSISRPLTNPEQWMLYHFESHARTCTTCIDPYEVHKAGGQLCDKGQLLAQDVARIIYSQHGGRDVFDVTLRQSDYAVKVELPRDYHEVRSLLKAMERSLRHRRQKPIVSFDRTYPVSKPWRRLSYQESPPVSRPVSIRSGSLRSSSSPQSSSPTKTSSTLSRSSRQSSPSSKHERRRSQIVEWPEDLLALEARAPPTAWKHSVPLPDSDVVDLRTPSTALHSQKPVTKVSASTSPSTRTATNVRPVTPESQVLKSRDHGSASPKAKAPRPLSSSDTTPSPSKSKRSSSSSPTRTKAAHASALAMLEGEAPSTSTARPTSREGPRDWIASQPLYTLPATEAKPSRRRSVKASDSVNGRRASMYEGVSFKTEVRQPKDRRWSALYD